MCRLLGISHSAYYGYEQRCRNCPDDLHRRQLLDAVKNIAESCDYTYGSRRMKQALNALAQEGWLYLEIVIYLFSRKVVGWSMSSRMKATLVCEALRMAIWLRRPPPGLIAQQDSRVAVCRQSIPQSTESIWF